LTDYCRRAWRAFLVARAIRRPKSIRKASEILKSVSRLGLLKSRSIKLMIEWERPDRCARTFMDIFRCKRALRSDWATFLAMASRNVAFGTP
jgi:hypothetical protein